MSCHRGEVSFDQCAAWLKSNNKPEQRAETEGLNHSRVPWSGSALGTSSFAFLTGRSEPKVIGLLGAHNAGKTTLLGAWYQLVARSGAIGERTFAGSYTLEGWEAIAHGLRWEGGPPSFPPHTSAGAGRAPGLLHLALRGDQGRLSDIFFSDAPGEWFHRWAIHRDAPDAEGARWLADRGSAFIVVADCESLASEEKGTARNNLVQLLRRLAAERQHRPVALLWTKSDILISQAIRDAIRQTAHLVIPDIVEFSVSILTHRQGDEDVEAAESMQKVLEWAAAPVARGVPNFETPVPSIDPFFSFGAHP